MPGPDAATEVIETDIPARLDRLPWSRWHLMVVVALGITWLLDGLEGNLAGSLAGILKLPDTLALTDAEIGLTSTIYLIGAVLGALFFGYLTDRLGRKLLFSVTLILYLSATAATAFSWNLASFTFFRALTGAGIGGEYAAINSAVDELIPARVRGHVDLLINSTYWVGAGLERWPPSFFSGPGFSPLILAGASSSVLELLSAWASYFSAATFRKVRVGWFFIAASKRPERFVAQIEKEAGAPPLPEGEKLPCLRPSPPHPHTVARNLECHGA